MKRGSTTLPVAAIALLTLASAGADAQEYSIWNGGTGIWSDPGNWTSNPPNSVPNGSTWSVYGTSGSINLDIDATIGGANLGAASLSLNGTSLSVTGNAATSILQLGGLALSDATVTVSPAASILEVDGGSTSWLTSTVTSPELFLDGSVTGTLLTLNTASATIIGSNGTGSLDLSSTTWNTAQIILGQNPGASGTLTLGALTTVTLGSEGGSGTLAVGAAGQGNLTVNGGTINSPGITFISVGGNPTGAGNGQILIENGGSIAATTAMVGFGGAGTTATLTVDGEGSSLGLGGIANAGMLVGGGTVTVSNSGAVSGGVLNIEYGQVNLQSQGTWKATVASPQPGVTIGTFGAGSTGTASLTVASGGIGSNEDSVLIGSNAGANGTFTLSGEGSTWASAGAVVVGVGGTGTLWLQEGAVLTSGPGDFESIVADTSGVSGNVGQMVGSSGTVTISGDGSAWNQSGALRVGDAGTGILNITDQAEVMATGLSVGAETGGQGTVTMTGGALTLAGTLSIGDAGTGVLTVLPGAPDDEGDVSSLNGVIGAQPGSSGQVTIGSAVGSGLQSTSSQWRIAQQLIVGGGGSGLLTIGGTITDLSADLGQTATGNGTVIVGNGGMWTTTNALTVGDSGMSKLTIDAGGFANVSVGAVTVGSQSGSKGTVDVLGQWNLAQNLVIGADGAGTLTVERGGAVASGEGVIAQNGTSKSTVTVTGNKSSWSINGTLYVGQGGTGTLLVSNSGQIRSSDGAIGQLAGSLGMASVTGAGSLWSATLSGGTGTISVGGAGTGLLNVQNSGQVTASSIVVNAGGTLNGQGGTIAATLVNAGGTITPGDATGTLTVNGNYTQHSGTSVFEIDGGGAYDQLHISGAAMLAGGEIDVLFANGFEPTVGETFDLITALDLSGDPSVVVSGLPSGYVLAEDFSATGLDLVTEQAPVPLPPTAWLMLNGLSLSTFIARRRTSKQC